MNDLRIGLPEDVGAILLVLEVQHVQRGSARIGALIEDVQTGEVSIIITDLDRITLKGELIDGEMELDGGGFLLIGLQSQYKPFRNGDGVFGPIV